jgi:hypothetical protein
MRHQHRTGLLLLASIAGAHPGVAWARQNSDGPRPAARAAAPESSLRSVIQSLRKYNAEAQRLLSLCEKGPLPAPSVESHWRDLAQLRARLERLETKGTLKSMGEGDRVGFRHELALLLGSPLDVAQSQGDYVPERVDEAQEQFKQDLLAVARLANRSLDFAVIEVAGHKVDESDPPPAPAMP